MKIFLIGFMGSGKTSIGKRLAKTLGWDFLDVDSIIESEANMTINSIFNLEGEQVFREMEREALKKVMNKENAVISTGGGTPCYEDNMQVMNDNGLTIYLEMETTALVRRLAEAKSKRPLIKDLTDVELQSFIKAKMVQRVPYYKQAQHTVASSHVTNALEQVKKIVKMT